MRFKLCARFNVFQLVLLTLVPMVAALASPSVLWAEDQIPPASPTGLSVDGTTCNHVSLSWVASKDEEGGSGLYAYVVQRWQGGSLWDEVTIRSPRTNFSDTNKVRESSTITYGVLAVDRAGNRSAASDPVTVTTPPCGASEVQSEGDFEGQLEVTISERAGKSQTEFALNTRNERLALHFGDDLPGRLLTGDQIHAKGILNDQDLSVQSGSSIETLELNLSSPTTTTSATTPSSWVIANTFGAQKTLVILVNFQDNPTLQPWTPDQVRSLVFGPVSNYFLENSYQQTWLIGDVFGWYTIPQSSTTCDELALKSSAEQAAAAGGAILSNYARYLYVFPNNACVFSGSSTIGGNPSKSMINGDFQLDVVAHELGHGLGLYHSHSYNQDGTTVEYGDNLDVMGASPSAHFNGFQKEVLGWLAYGNSPPIATVQTSGTYVLDPYESPGSGPKVLKILKSFNSTTGKSVWYYVEHRSAIGFDSYIGTVSTLSLDGSNVLNGVVIHTGSDLSGNTNYLLDMTPATWQMYSQDPALDVGKTFSDPLASVTITPVWADASGAGVNVSFSSACAHANPKVTFTPSSQSAKAGSSLTYSVAVTNNDGSNCSASTFNLQASLPTGWAAAFGVSSLTISPGANGSTTLIATSSPTASAASYSLSALAANGSYSGTTTGTYTVTTTATLAATVSTDKSVYASGDTVAISSTVKLDGRAVSKASVTFTVTSPNGASTSQTSSTDTNGAATYKLRLNRQKNPAGTYQVRVSVTSNGLSTGASASFTVQ